MPTTYATRLAAGAEAQYDLHHFDSENDPALARQIQRYWTDLGFGFPGVDTPWSAVFVSWCVKKAGATRQDFHFDPSHSVFVHEAIRNAVAGTGSFRAYPITAYAPRIGDIIHNNRGGGVFDYAYAQAHTGYNSHSAIVVEVGTDSDGGYAMTIGGNESDSVRKKLVRLTPKGLVRQRKLSPYICVIQDLL